MINPFLLLIYLFWGISLISMVANPRPLQLSLDQQGVKQVAAGIMLQLLLIQSAVMWAQLH